MQPFDFRQVIDGAPLPLDEQEFLFTVTGSGSAMVRLLDGIHCGYKAYLILKIPTNTLILDIVNGAGLATINAWVLGPHGLMIGGSRQFQSAPNVQSHRFDLTAILQITLESMNELYLQGVH